MTLVLPICTIEEVDTNEGSYEICVAHDTQAPCDRGGLPWILLDVDGVINAFPNHSNSKINWRTGMACPESGVSFTEMMAQREQASKALAGGWVHGNMEPRDDRKFKITWDETIIERLLKFQEDGLCRIAWLTTWGEGARGELSELMGLPDMPCFKHPGQNDLWSHSQWWKFKAVEREFEYNSPEKLVWLDDDLIVEKRAREYAKEKGWLPIAPFQHEGLTHDHLDRIEAYLTTADDEAV